MYCKHCLKLVRGKECDVCGNEKLIEPTADDLVLVAEKSVMWAGMLADVFRKNHIVFFIRERFGAAITALVGSGIETQRFYVRLSQYNEAVDILEGLFGAGQLHDDFEELDDDDDEDDEDFEDDEDEELDENDSDDDDDDDNDANNDKNADNNSDNDGEDFSDGNDAPPLEEE